jgi:hypothetical protein
MAKSRNAESRIWRRAGSGLRGINNILHASARIR